MTAVVEFHALEAESMEASYVDQADLLAQLAYDRGLTAIGDVCAAAANGDPSARSRIADVIAEEIYDIPLTDLIDMIRAINA